MEVYEKFTSFTNPYFILATLRTCSLSLFSSFADEKIMYKYYY